MRPRALALRALGLGDLLAGVPALRTLRRALPGHEIVLAAPQVMAPLVALVDGVHHLPTAELAPIPWPHDRAPEIAVDLHGNGPASARLLAALGPDRLLAFAPGWSSGLPSGRPGPAWRRDEHERHRWCRLVSQGLGAPVSPDDADDVRLPDPGPSVRPGAVVVHPGAAAPSRRWPVERFAAVAAELASRTGGAGGSEVVVTGGPAEAALAQEVAARAGLAPDAVLAGRTGLPLRGLAALVAHARLVVCGDTGLAHLASAFATPSVVLMGPIAPTLWGPPASGPHIALWRGDPRTPGDPHGRTLDPALAALSVDDVLAAAAVLL